MLNDSNVEFATLKMHFLFYIFRLPKEDRAYSLKLNNRLKSTENMFKTKK